MAEEDLLIDIPIEPNICTPKSISYTAADGSPSRRKPTSTDFDSFSILKILNKGKFPVYLVNGLEKDQEFALKMFPNHQDGSLQSYMNEIRFAFLNHPHIIKVIHHEKNWAVEIGNDEITSAFILSEYALYGDFFDFVEKSSAQFTDELIRTYFKQLIEGLEYLHSKNIAHLDLKLENLLIDEDFALKIADFDLSIFVGDGDIVTKGTEFYRSPELINGTCVNGQVADIYSAGTILFALKCGGVAPHIEKGFCRGVNLLELLEKNKPEFWKKHCEIQSRPPSFFSEDFKELISGMLERNPVERFSIQEIKNSKWFNGPVYSKKELASTIKSLI